MNKGEKLALFLGMLSGDGCLSKCHNGKGYRFYPIDFMNTNRELVYLFDQLFLDLFGVRGKIHSRIRINRKEIWEFRKTSKDIYYKILKLGFPEGVKRDILRIPSIIFNGNKKEKSLFILGVIITDGSLKNKGIMFHSGSKLFLEDLSRLISEFIGEVKPIKEYSQKEIYKSYQLYLNNKEKETILKPTWDNGTPFALRANFLRDFPVRFRASAFKESNAHADKKKYSGDSGGYL